MRNYSSLSVLLAVFCLLNATHGIASVTNTFHPVYFQTDSSALSTEARQQLSDLVKQLPATGEIEISLAGHTDAEGNSQYNQQLSEARASSVEEELTRLGIQPEIIRYNYFGETKPVSTNRSETGKAKNRRVEIAVKHTVINSISDIMNMDSVLAPQQFVVKTAQEQTIKGRKGIEISIPADAFTDLSGKEIKAGKATVTLTEFTGISDAFFHGITTMSDKGLLESGGMFRLDASADGKPLQLKAGKELDVKIPSAKPEADMKVYLSKTDSTGKIVWVETDSAFKPSKQPVDLRTINLERDKYSSFLATAVYVPGVNSIPSVKEFMAVKPPQPVHPKLRLQEQIQLKRSGLSAVTKNKKAQQKLLDRMNSEIQLKNEKRAIKYQKQLEQYLTDSASFPARTKEYLKAKMDFVDYSNARKKELDTLLGTYKQAVIKKRLIYYLRTLLEASENRVLYNANLVQRCRNFCTTDNFLFRDFAFEKKINTTYPKLKMTPGIIYYDLGLWGTGKYYANESFKNVLQDPEVNRVMTQLVDDNPYLTAEERKVQKAIINTVSIATGYPQYEENSYYRATVGQLGYVNCDRVYQAADVIALNIDKVNKQAESVAFIKGVNASQPFYSGNNSFKKNEELMLLSVYFENGRPLVAYNQIKLNSPQKVELEYKEMKTDEFKELVLSFI